MIKFIEIYNSLGRPTLRFVGVIIIAAIGLAVAVAFWRWAFGAPMQAIPAEGVLLALVTQGPQIVDLVTRHLQKTTEIAYNNRPPGTSR